jgi:predicted PurR-regulated permease PerM
MTDEKPQTARLGLLQCAALVVVLAGLRSAAAIVVPFLLVLFIAILCDPPVEWLVRKGTNRLVAVVLVLLGVFVIQSAMVVALGTSFRQFSDAIPFYQERITQLLDDAAKQLSRLGIVDINQEVRKLVDPGIVMSSVRDVLGNLGSVLANTFLILLAVVFLLLEAPALNAALARFEGPNEQGVNLARLFSGINRYMALKAVISLLSAVTVTIGLWLLDIDFPLLWGLLTFLLNFIPNIGSIMSAVPPVVLAMIQHGFGAAIAAALLFATMDLVYGSILEPRLIGRSVELSAFVVLVSLVFWGWLLGPVGMLLSVPLTLAVKLALEGQPETRWLAALLGGEATPPNPAKAAG